MAEKENSMVRTKKYARYAPWGLGYQVWAPGEDRAEYWFGSLEDVFEFAADCGWKLKRI